MYNKLTIRHTRRCWINFCCHEIKPFLHHHFVFIHGDDAHFTVLEFLFKMSLQIFSIKIFRNCSSMWKLFWNRAPFILCKHQKINFQFSCMMMTVMWKIGLIFYSKQHFWFVSSFSETVLKLSGSVIFNYTFTRAWFDLISFKLNCRLKRDFLSVYLSSDIFWCKMKCGFKLPRA